MDLVWMVLLGLGLIGAAWYGLHMDPHWVSKDGLAFTCKLQRIDERGLPASRWLDARGLVEEGKVTVRLRSHVAPSRQTGHYVVLKRVAAPAKGTAVFLLDGEDVNGHGFAALRIPASSRAGATLDGIIVPTT